MDWLTFSSDYYIWPIGNTAAGVEGNYLSFRIPEQMFPSDI